MFIKQSTLKNPIFVNGFGLHSGKKVSMSLKPSSCNSGIIFRRLDLCNVVDVPAVISNVVNTKFSTVLMKDGVYIKTVEHLLSALFAFAIDNVIIELDDEEVPIMDGSSYPFIYLLKLSGIKFQDSPKKFLKIKKYVDVVFENGFACFEPFEKLRIELCLKFQSTLFVHMDSKYEFDFDRLNYINFISKARTFGFYSDYNAFLLKGLAQGAKFNNVLVFNNDTLINDNMCRYKDEIFRHKVLDVCGDMFLLGKQIIGVFCSFKPGHTINGMLLNKLLLESHAYDIVLYHKKFGYVLY